MSNLSKFLVLLVINIFLIIIYKLFVDKEKDILSLSFISIISDIFSLVFFNIFYKISIHNFVKSKKFIAIFLLINCVSLLLSFFCKKVKINDELLNIIYCFSISLIFFLFINVFLTSVLYIFKLNITYFNFIFSILSTIIFLTILLHKKDISIFKNILMNIILILVIFSTIFVSSKIIDVTYDGDSYHKNAIYNLKNGWNPIYEDINQKDKYPSYNVSNNIWINHYAKAYYMYAANIYKVTNNIESGKSFGLLLIISSILLVFYYLKRKFNLKNALLFSILIVFNPITLTQMVTYYNDFVLGLFLTNIIFLSFIHYDDKFKKDYLYLFLSLNLILVSNIKFTGLIYSIIYLFIYLIYLFINKKKEEIIKLIKIFTIVYFIAVFIVGLSTYPKNMLLKSNPFYPLMGKNKIDIMTMNQPKNFKNMNRFEKFIRANFSYVDNIYYATGKIPKLKIPFTFKREEIKILYYVDNRIGGYGIFFGGILIFFMISLIVLFIYKTKKTIYLLLIIYNLIIIVILKDAWWARYLPQLYLFPFIVIMMIKELKEDKKILKFLEQFLLLFLIFNFSFTFISPVFKLKNTIAINNKITTLINNQKLKKVCFTNRDFLSSTYILEDKKIKFELKICDNERKEEIIPNILYNIVE